MERKVSSCYHDIHKSGTQAIFLEFILGVYMAAVGGSYGRNSISGMVSIFLSGLSKFSADLGSTIPGIKGERTLDFEQRAGSDSRAVMSLHLELCRGGGGTYSGRERNLQKGNGDVGREGHFVFHSTL